MRKVYGTRSSQAVPHPSTILARRCLTSVIGREQVCSSWYGRRQKTVTFCSTHSSSSFSLHTTSKRIACDVAFLASTSTVQIKNIKLQIVTDIKVSIDSSSLSGFRLGWGWALSFTKKATQKFALSCFRTSRKKIVPDVRCFKLRSKSESYQKPTTPGVPRRSPIQVLSWPDDV